MKYFLQFFSFSIAFLLSLSSIKAQPTTAMDFNRLDCNENQQHLFADLDAGNVVILEFFMQNCSPCITAGGQLEQMKTSLLAQFPGKIKSYAIGFTDSYTCGSNLSWVNTNGFTSIPMDSGALQVAYYGGFGMPTIVILGGGTTHSILGMPYIGFANGDITTMTTDITNFLNATAIDPFSAVGSDMNVFPNPATNQLNVSFNLHETANVSIEILNTAGQTLSVAMTETLPVGLVNQTISTKNLVSGLYVVKITANGNSTYRKVSVVN